MSRRPSPTPLYRQPTTLWLTAAVVLSLLTYAWAGLFFLTVVPDWMVGLFIVLAVTAVLCWVNFLVSGMRRIVTWRAIRFGPRERWRLPVPQRNGANLLLLVGVLAVTLMGLRPMLLALVEIARFL